jgi:hypothetical protein
MAIEYAELSRKERSTASDHRKFRGIAVCRPARLWMLKRYAEAVRAGHSRRAAGIKKQCRELGMLDASGHWVEGI